MFGELVKITVKNITVVPKSQSSLNNNNKKKRQKGDQKGSEGEGHYSVTQSLVEDSPPSTGTMKVLPC